MTSEEPAPSPQRGADHDEWVVLRCQMGERDAFDLLIARWHEPLWRYALRVTGDADAAADVVQEVWLRVLRGFGRLREAARFQPWLFGIARRVLMDRLRARYAAPRFEEVDMAELPGVAVEDDRAEDLALLEAGLSELPVLERDVLVLFYLQKLSLNDIADIAAIPVGTVKSRLFRARKMLRERLIIKGVQP
ncbi:MAG: sigma-70 family RNA polymerase sigma factor [Vicinamibacterales bacterium]